MKRFLVRLCLRRRLRRLHRIARQCMLDYLRVAEAFECSPWEVEVLHPWLAKYRLLARRCAIRARRLHRGLGISSDSRPAPSSY